MWCVSEASCTCPTYCLWCVSEASCTCPTYYILSTWLDGRAWSVTAVTSSDTSRSQFRLSQVRSLPSLFDHPLLNFVIKFITRAFFFFFLILLLLLLLPLLLADTGVDDIIWWLNGVSCGNYKLSLWSLQNVRCSVVFSRWWRIL